MHRDPPKKIQIRKVRQTKSLNHSQHKALCLSRRARLFSLARTQGANVATLTGISAQYNKSLFNPFTRQIRAFSIAYSVSGTLTKQMKV